MNEKEEKPMVLEVLFAGRKGKDDILIGPFYVKASNRLMAVAKAAIENSDKFKGIDLFSLEVKVRGF